MTPLHRLEWEHIHQALHETGGNVSAAARLLGTVSYTHLDVYKRQVFLLDGNVVESGASRDLFTLSLIHI